MKRMYYVRYRYSRYADSYQYTFDNRTDAIREAERLYKMVMPDKGGLVRIICESCTWENGHKV